ncbi:MAG: PKD domain-containing protein, partial [Thermoplasmata archaeon]
MPEYFDNVQYVCSGNITDVESGDFNNDGHVDLAFATDLGSIEIFINSGSTHSFSSQYTLLVTPEVEVTSFTVGDFNSDGLADIAYADSEAEEIGVMMQNAEPIPFSLPADHVLSASTLGAFSSLMNGDLTGDGKSDIIGLKSGDKRGYLFDQSRFIETVPSDIVDFPEVPRFVGVFDATDDGFDDIVALFEATNLLFLYRQANGTPESGILESPSMVFVTGASPCWAMIGDATNDHRGDLIVCNAGSRSVSAWEQVNFPPVADAGGPYTAYQGDPFTFNGSAVTGASEIPFMEYRWDFDGDDEWDTEWVREPFPVYTYMSLGEFNITMEVRDPWGLNDTDYTTVSVVDSYPHASFTIEPYPPVEGVTIYFNDTTTSYDEVVLMNWSVDGALVESGLVGSIEDVFDNGLHSVSLEVTDSDGSVTNHTEIFAVLAVSPEVVISAPLVVDEGSEVVFEALVDSSAGEPWDPIVSYEWNFSYDGEPFVANETTYVNTTSHVFSADGDSEVYSIAVKVTDVDGNYSMAFHDLTVLDIGPDATLALSTPTPGEGLPFHFVASDSPDGIISWSWSITGPDGYTGAYSLTAEEMLAVEFVLPDGDYTMTLIVSETDGDEDEFDLDFSVAELPPVVSMSTLPLPAEYYEFDIVTLSASIESYDEAVLYEWDFMASGGEFMADSSSTVNSTEHSYLWTGHYTAKVNVTDSDGSYAIALVTVEIRDRNLTGTFDDVTVTRGAPPASSTMTFNASYFAETYPDLSNVLWEFGDGSELLRTGPPSTPVVHEYDPVRDYQINITMTDDDGNVLVVTRVLPLVQPAIELISPSGNAVVAPGTSIRFSVSDDTIPLEYVRYSLNGGAPVNFTTLYEIDTSGWTDGVYTLCVVAEDRDGNVAVLDGIVIAIDSVAPMVTLLVESNITYAGDKLN